MDVRSSYGRAEGSGWYYEGTKAHVAVAGLKYDERAKLHYVPLAEGVRAVFKRWSGDATEARPELNLNVTRPMLLEARFAIQHRVRVVLKLRDDQSQVLRTSESWVYEGERLALEDLVPAEVHASKWLILASALKLVRVTVNGSERQLGEVLAVEGPLEVCAYYTEALVYVPLPTAALLAAGLGAGATATASLAKRRRGRALPRAAAKRRRSTRRQPMKVEGVIGSAIPGLSFQRPTVRA